MSEFLGPQQMEIRTLTAKDLNGVEMGVLEDGTAFLTGRGLAAVCGVAPSVINQWANEYKPTSTKPRDEIITRILWNQKYEGSSLFFKTKLSGQGEVNAYPEAVCMAVLEYYAFEADRKSDTALQNYRVLARAGLRAFIYGALGYDPSKSIPKAFESFHDRLLLNRLPAGYFSAFSETAHVVLAAIRAGLTVDQHTVPDISVGKRWSQYWTDNNLEPLYGARTKHPHNYPEDYPQSAAATEAYIYPVKALGVFRIWLDQEYLPSNYPDYIRRKVRAGAMPASRAELLLSAVVVKSLGG